MLSFQESPDGVDIGDVMRPWFEQMGLPVVDIAFVRSHVQVTQTRFLDNPDADRSQPPAKYKLVTFLSERDVVNS